MLFRFGSFIAVLVALFGCEYARAVPVRSSVRRAEVTRRLDNALVQASELARAYMRLTPSDSSENPGNVLRTIGVIHNQINSPVNRENVSMEQLALINSYVAALAAELGLLRFHDETNETNQRGTLDDLHSFRVWAAGLVTDYEQHRRRHEAPASPN